MDKAIIDTTTRVIKRLTTEENPSISDSESVVEVSEKIDLSGGFYKLNNKKEKIAATEKESIDAGVNEEKIAIKNKEKQDSLQSLILDIADNGATLDKLQSYFKLLK